MWLSMFVACSTLLGVAADDDGTTPAWRDFLHARSTGTTPLLPDFSYAGYQFSERPLPDVSARPRFDVTAYGAVPDDSQFDDDAIQAAVDAAEAASGGVVFFPPGKYLIAADQDRGQHIRVSHDHVVLKGSGGGEGGTEIFARERRVGARQFVFRPRRQRTEQLATIVSSAGRETFWVEVSDASGLRVGQSVVIRCRSEAFTRRYFDPLPLAPQWTRLVGPRGGMQLAEIHTVDEIDGNRVRFHNPLHFDLVVQPDVPFHLESYTTLVDCGLEDLRLTGHWDSYPEEFVHHKDAIHDSGWCAVDMENVEDSWIRHCEFRNWNECVHIRGGYKVSVDSCSFTGKKGHTSIHARTGYGVLIKNCRFPAGHHHGPGTGYGGVNTVITQCQMEVDQNIDSHSGQPFATLYDDVAGGVFWNLGGPLPGLPHHGRHMVFWNFRHRATRDFHYDFWDVAERRNYTIAEPIFVGFQADTKITFRHEGLNESPDAMVEPRSLFAAQLDLRLQGRSESVRPPRGEVQTPGENAGGQKAAPRRPP
jgi:hypothetical protein